MQTRVFFLIVLVVLLAVTAFGQKFEIDSEGRGMAVTPEVQRLMDEADQIIAEMASARAAADKRMAGAEADLQVAVADEKTNLLQLHKAKIGYINAIGDMVKVRGGIGDSIHKVTIAYFENVIAITHSGKKLAKDGYGEWQEKALAAKKYVPTNRGLFRDADAAIAVARERDKKRFDLLREEMRRISELEREMREKSKI